MKMASGSTSRKLAAPCGLYCGMCTMYRAYHDKNLALMKEAPKNFLEALDLPAEPSFGDIACEGCRSSSVFSFCLKCDIRKCVAEKKVTWCFECEEFPCEKLFDFQSDWQIPIVDNLREIKKIGVDEWLKKADKRWRCSKCGSPLHWFSYGICSKCK